MGHQQDAEGPEPGGEALPQADEKPREGGGQVTTTIIIIITIITIIITVIPRTPLTWGAMWATSRTQRAQSQAVRPSPRPVRNPVRVGARSKQLAGQALSVSPTEHELMTYTAATTATWRESR